MVPRVRHAHEAAACLIRYPILAGGDSPAVRHPWQRPPRHMVAVAQCQGGCVPKGQDEEVDVHADSLVACDLSMSVCGQHQLQEELGLTRNFFHRHTLKCKMQWLMREFGIPAEKCWNFDKTGIFLVPRCARSWSSKNPEAQRTEDETPRLDTNLAVHALSPVPLVGPAARQALVTLQGKTLLWYCRKLCSPRCSACMTQSEDHWTTQETILSFARHIDAEVTKDGCGGHWLLLLDVGPCHTAAVRGNA